MPVTRIGALDFVAATRAKLLLSDDTSRHDRAEDGAYTAPPVPASTP